MAHRGTSPAGARHIGVVLEGCRYPASKARLLVHAQRHGVDDALGSALWSLPRTVYRSLAEVLMALDLLSPPARRGRRGTPDTGITP